MSGIIGIVRLDGAPVDRRLVQRLTESQSFRGPDAQEIWVNGNVGLGHTLLKTTEESELEHQPFTFGNDLWIVADARVDARPELIAELQAHGHKEVGGAPDVELILRAYEVWGEDCVEHLLGDFAFGIWDGQRQKLFCARDQLGVKCFYYAHIGSCVIFSNSIECIRRHPAVSGRLNDLAIADHILFEMNLDQAGTSFADIQRIPPAQKASWTRDGVRLSCYWTMPIEEPVFYKRASDYTDCFMELMGEAVSDRLRTNRVGILMSGGLDSPALAAVACKLSRERGLHLELKAFTTTLSFGPDEGYYAALVAKHLGIPIEYRDGDEESIHPNWEQAQFHTPEPVSNTAVLPIHPTQWDHIGQYSRVFLQGGGPDNALSIEWKPYVSYLLRNRRYGRLLRDAGLYLAWHRRIPFWGKISGKFRKSEFDGAHGPSFPPWLNKDLVSRFHLHARWESYYSPPPAVHPVRPLNYALFQIHGELQKLFRSHDAECTQAPVEVRYPFLDVRLLRFFLAIPTIPWCRSKYVIRRAMKAMLPEQVLRRPKEGLATDVIMERLELSRPADFTAAPELHAYVDTTLLPATAGTDVWASGSILLARLLNHWLQSSYHYGHNATEEVVSK
jgi:asparagine synthase (glutamine-hydrolysing)